MPAPNSCLTRCICGTAGSNPLRSSGESTNHRFLGSQFEAIKRADLPNWMRREEVFDIDPERDRDEERWKALVLVLRSDGRTRRA
jgi:hypothetical protein